MALSRAAKLRQAYPFKSPSTAIDHLVVGGGVVGLSIAAALVNSAGKGRTTFLVEKTAGLGNQAGTRRSEVINSGIYYPIGSLKSRLCIRGRDLLYARCTALDIPHRKTEKLIVATSNSQVPWLDRLSTLSAHPSLVDHNKPSSPYTSNSTVPAYFLSGGEACELEPDLSRDIAGALLIPDAGIVDLQNLVLSLQKEITDESYVADRIKVGAAIGERGAGVVMNGTRVVRIDRDEKDRGWVVQLETGWEGLQDGITGEVESILAGVVVNAAGLGAASLMEGVVPDSERVAVWPTKNSHMAYSGPGVSNVSRLIHACPNPNDETGHSASNLSIDLNGNIRFGPSVEAIGTPAELLMNPDLSQDHKHPSPPHHTTIQHYLPGIDPSLLTPEYVEITPELSEHSGEDTDFLIRHSPDRRGLVEMYGLTEPGVTAALAIGEYVTEIVRNEVHG